MIKHAFQNAGIWPVSFKAIKRKLKEYGKKTKKDTSLYLLEYGLKLELNDLKVIDKVTKLVLDPMLIKEY
jgi:hypothetical protein